MARRSAQKKGPVQEVEQAHEAEQKTASDKEQVEAEFLEKESDLVGKDYSDLPLHEGAALRCKDRIEEAIKDYTKSFYIISLGFLEAYENNYASIWGFENFSEYVKEHLGMDPRVAYSMVDIGKLIRKFGIEVEQAQRIGWTKLAVVSTAIRGKTEDISRYLEMAENMSREALKDALKAEVQVTEARGATTEIMRMSLKFEGDLAGIMSDALALAYGDIGKEDASFGLTHIAGEWLVARGSAPTGASLEDYISFIHKFYGVRLVRAEEEDSIDALLTGAAQSQEDDVALEELLSSTEEELENLTN
ncbi:MAG: hypothetical protein LBQ51_02320 [Desulfovibrio sp.]|jgi:hypothetical protein|nr:hypothetical protein [Desulfovibrio sp.]